MKDLRPTEQWNTRLGAILAVAGSAVGLGNFLRFPGQVALYGGGTFMIAYAVSFLMIGIPLCLAEWTLGRYGGRMGFHSSAGILACAMRHPIGKYIGVFNIMVPVCLFMYYACVEAWTLGYAVNAVAGNLEFENMQQAEAFFAGFVGLGADGAAATFSVKTAGIFLGIVLVINLLILWRGVSRGIEVFCKYAMPALLLMGLVILVRVLTLGTPDPAQPERSVNNGLGFMWNPTKLVLEARESPQDAWRQVPAQEGGTLIGPIAIERAQAQVSASPETLRVRHIGIGEQLLNPQIWLAAASQVFFTLSVGMGVLSTYASYLKRRDDIVVSSLSSASVNEFSEVILGGLITLPAGVAFLGVAGLAGMCSTFELGFKVLPLVFGQIPFGMLFAALFFFLLFLAAATSSISMLQPGVALFEEVMGVNRRQALAILSTLTVLGAGYCFYFSENLSAIATLDFWGGNFLVFVCGMINIIVFSWVFPLSRGWKEMHTGSAVKLPNFMQTVFRFVCPGFLIVIFAYWMLGNAFGPERTDSPVMAHFRELFVEPSPVAWGAVLIMGFFFVFGTLVIKSSNRLDRAHLLHDKRRKTLKRRRATKYP